MIVEHDPKETTEVNLDWTGALAGDVIISATWTVPAGLTLINESYTSGSSSAAIEGGELGKTYLLECNIVSSNGAKKHTVVCVRMKNK